jgi:hypothetical protein
MLPHMLKSGWKGESADELLRKGNVLSEEVRAFSRKHLVPPRLSATQQKSRA